MTMKKSWVLGVVSLLVTTTTAVQTKANSQTGATVPLADKPSLDGKIVLDGKNATITYKVSNLHLSAEHMGGQNVQGEGHLHLIVDGQQKAMLNTDAPVKLENLTTGKHTIKLDLQRNDHSDLNVEKIFQIEVK
jgi:hypothetical protein